MSFSQFDLTNLQEGVEGVGNAILRRKVMEQQQQDKETQRAQQALENQQRTRQLDISEAGQKSTEQIRKDQLSRQTSMDQGTIQNNAAKLDAAKQAAIEKIKAGTAAAAATGEKNSHAFVTQSRQNLAKMVKDGTVTAEQATAMDNAMITQGDPTFLGHLKNVGIQPITFTTPPKPTRADAPSLQQDALATKLEEQAQEAEDSGDVEQAQQLRERAKRQRQAIPQHVEKPPKPPSLGSQSTETTLDKDGKPVTKTTVRRPLGPLDQPGAPASSPGFRAGTAGGTVPGYEGNQVQAAHTNARPTSEPAAIKTMSEYNALPKGAFYIDPVDGKKKQKQ